MIVRAMNGQESYKFIWELTPIELNTIITYMLKTYKCNDINTFYNPTFNDTIAYETFRIFGYFISNPLIDKISNMLYLFETIEKYESQFDF